jgi:hypothetical protein
VENFELKLKIENYALSTNLTFKTQN